MNLKNVKYFIELRRLRLPLNKILIVGSGTMALLGLKENNDIDLWVAEDVFEAMKTDPNFKPIMKEGRLFYESKSGNIEASNTMPCTKGGVEVYIKRAILIYGFHFMSVNDLIYWKKCMRRPKDLVDLKKLLEYKRSGVVENYLQTLQRLI
jgi:hypothetical protein